MKSTSSQLCQKWPYLNSIVLLKRISNWLQYLYFIEDSGSNTKHGCPWMQTQTLVFWSLMSHMSIILLSPWHKIMLLNKVQTPKYERIIFLDLGGQVEIACMEEGQSTSTAKFVWWEMANLENCIVDEGGGHRKAEVNTWWATKTPTNNHSLRDPQGFRKRSMWSGKWFT